MSPERNHFDNGIAGDDELDETDRMVALIESVTTKFDANDPGAVESLFTGQALALDVIFKEFIKRRSYTFDGMRVALKAQAQCRSTFKSLAEFKIRAGPPRAVLHEIRANRLLKTRKAPHDQALA